MTQTQKLERLAKTLRKAQEQAIDIDYTLHYNDPVVVLGSMVDEIETIIRLRGEK